MDTQELNLQDSKTKITMTEPGNCEKHNIPFKIERIPIFGERVFKFCSKCREEEKIAAEERERAIEALKKQELINRRIDNAMVAPRFKDKTLENYKVVNDEQAKIIEDVKWFLENLSCTGLIFIGKPGTGKNHLASAIVKEVIKKNKIALMTEAVKAVRAVKESWKGNGETESQVMARFSTPDLLVIDELGVQSGSDTERRVLTEIINDRYNYKKPTILIGNVTISELEIIIGDRALDRFKEGGRVLVFNWESWRAVQGNSFE